MRSIQLLIGGRQQPSGDGNTFDRCNPVSGAKASEL